MTRTAARLLVDWGTTNLRAFLLDAAGEVLERTQSDQGILRVAPAEMPALLDRIAEPWNEELGPAEAEGRPVVLCGMVGSANGWTEVPYLSCPTGFEQLPQAAARLRTPAGRAAVILPGLTHRRRLNADLAQADVMRGEETQIFGALEILGRKSATFCLPGTHSKWARVAEDRCVDFGTYMTGELYDVLTRHSLLGRLMQRPPAETDRNVPEGFIRGLVAAEAADGLLGALFSTRADVLAELMPGSAGAGYLSGLLIGHEVREARMRFGTDRSVVLVGAKTLVPLYEAALDKAGIAVERVDGEAAVIAGLSRAARMLEG